MKLKFCVNVLSFRFSSFWYKTQFVRFYTSTLQFYSVSHYRLDLKYLHKLNKHMSSTSGPNPVGRLVECVPNFSEGRDPQIISAIGNAINGTKECLLLETDSSCDANRTVYTFVGNETSVVEGALAAARVAREMIDMSKHKGEHPRIGALDVCPFIPLQGTSIDDCVRCSLIFAERLATEIKVPVHLYEFSQDQAHRKYLPQIRQGEYENLPNKLKSSDWLPDYGLPEFVPEWGATVTGARNFLIAFNVNLLGTKEQAHRIALNIRESGRGPQEPGIFPSVRAVGWWLEEHKLAQVSINLTNMDLVGMHHVFEECKKQAKLLKLAVVGSELVGMVPLRAILDTAEFYCKEGNLFLLEERERVQLVVSKLGLNTLEPFKMDEKIIEFKLPKNESSLLKMTIPQFIADVSARTPLPGGGCVAALVASLGAGLATMYANLSYGQRKYDKIDSIIRESLPTLYNATQQLMPAIQKDYDSYQNLMAAYKLPKSNEEQKNARNAAIELATKEAIESPLDVMRAANQCWVSILIIGEVGNAQALSDLQVGAKCLEAGIYAAMLNVKINLVNLQDDEYHQSVLQEATQIYEDAKINFSNLSEIIDNRQNTH